MELLNTLLDDPGFSIKLRGVGKRIQALEWDGVSDPDPASFQLGNQTCQALIFKLSTFQGD